MFVMFADSLLTSSLRKQGPIAIGLYNDHKRPLACQQLTSRGMGPGSRSLCATRRVARSSLGRNDGK
jgi:hypothetical protein